jgi:hypothetical protein
VLLILIAVIAGFRCLRVLNLQHCKGKSNFFLFFTIGYKKGSFISMPWSRGETMVLLWVFMYENLVMMKRGFCVTELNCRTVRVKSIVWVIFEI